MNSPQALSVNEVGSGLMINDTLQGVPVSVSASLIMNLVSKSGFCCNDYVTQEVHSCSVSTWIAITEMSLFCLLSSQALV